MRAELKNEIETFLSKIRNKTKSDKLNICAHVYEIIARDPASSVELLRFFYNNADRIQSSDQETADTIITEEMAKSLHECYSEVVDAMFEQLLEKNLPEEDFYTKLWEMINQSPTFEDENAKIFAFFYIWIDVRIPYYQLDNGLAMSNEEFRELSDSLITNIQKARFIMRTTMFKQRTSRASVLLDLLDSVSEEKERVVLMAHILSFTAPGQLNPRVLREVLDKLLGEGD